MEAVAARKKGFERWYKPNLGVRALRYVCRCLNKVLRKANIHLFCFTAGQVSDLIYAIVSTDDFWKSELLESGVIVMRPKNHIALTLSDLSEVM